MKHHQKQFISKENGYKALTIVFFIAASAYILFPIQQTPILQEVSFVLSDSNAQSHGAAGQWDYLFDDNSGSQVYTGQLTVDPQPSQQINVQPNTQQQIPSTATTSGKIVSGIYTGKLSITPAQQQTSTTLQQGTKSCTAPRGETVTNKEFVLAYEQRKDVPTICNVQKRICNNGILDGTYVQESCKEDVQYSYTRTQVISENQPQVDPLVQPQPASNAGAAFSTDGKINAAPQQATTSRGTGNDNVTTSTQQQQTPYLKSNCRTPRGTTVKHGQFVKAYKSSIGLIDVPCETEIRLCVNGALKGRFLNQTCTFKNMTYNDYLEGNTNITKPTTKDIIDTLTPSDTTTTSYSLTNWIRNLFR